MTEEEAKTKWCPYARCSPKDDIGSGMNRWRGKEHLPVGTFCIASACMAWRFYDTGSTPGDVPKGFCGLAGFPYASLRPSQ